MQIPPATLAEVRAFSSTESAPFSAATTSLVASSASGRSGTTKRPSSNPPEPKSFGMPETTPGKAAPLKQENSFAAGNSSRIGNKSLELQKPENTNLTDKLSNRFNQLKKQAGEQANNVNNKLNSNTRNVADSADNTLRNVSDQAGRIKQNLAGTGSKNSNIFPSNFKPGREPPQIVTRRSNPARQSNPSNQLSERAITNSTDSAARALNQSTQSGNRVSGAGNVPVQLPRTNPVTRRNSSLGTPIQNRNAGQQVVSQVSAARLTKATPGDRKLEGMQSPSVTIEKITD